ncbi:glycosyltransferase [Synechococcus sp. AH-551-J03]|nr:glycosyltransferase [Synechococcus sp. AH-551-J03]
MASSPLVLVLGMHRSGTSLLGGVLQHLGLDLPGEVIAADQHNPAGYFEWDQIVAIQERLLIDLEHWWPSAQGCFPLPSEWMLHPATLAARAQIRALLAPERALQSGPWGLKDPRCSRLLPLWLDLAEDLGSPLRLVLACRDPVEVATSLVHRDGPITGMDHNRAQQLWWVHNRDVLQVAAAARLPVTVIDYGRWFSAPDQQLSYLLEALPELQPSLEQQQQALASVRPDLRRSAARAKVTALGSERLPVWLDPAVKRLHRELLALQEQATGEPMPRRWREHQVFPRRLARGQAVVPEAKRLRAQPESWPQWLEAWRHHPAPQLREAVLLGPSPKISCCGMSWLELKPQLLLQHLPIPELAHRELDAAASSDHQLHLCPAAEQSPKGLEHLAINLELPAPDRVWHWLNLLLAQEAIWDPDPARVLLLRALGLKAWWLDLEAVPNGWLFQTGALSPSRWASLLGLAPPIKDSLLVLGPAGSDFERALALEASQPPVAVPIGSRSAQVPIQYQPGWPELMVSGLEEAVARAGWLQAAAQSAGRLIWPEASLPGESALLQGMRHSPVALEPSFLPTDLRELGQAEKACVLVEERAAQDADVLIEFNAPQQAGDVGARAAVVVSLYNYADRIEEALNSVAEQTEALLELVVVDDASSDGGAEVVRAWMQAHQTRFCRCLLLRHRRNCGLAAARNTAFHSAHSAWCFVLDADNLLFPAAVATCMNLAEQADDAVAVVHPLLAVDVEAGRPDELRSLVGFGSWQKAKFRAGNYVDAMALIRRVAWQQVGGYTHIEGGWEDFDFWCKLVEARFHGVQCPQILAAYRSHASSMTAHSTRRLQRPLSITLQNRHPWLALPLALD